MIIYKLKKNNDVFKFDTLEFTDDIKLTEESKGKLVEYLNTILEPIECKTDKEFMSVITEELNINDYDRIGNTIDIYTTNKNIFQMCYLEDSKDEINFFGTVINSKRKLINGNVFILANSLLTTKIDNPENTLDFIKTHDVTLDDIIEIIISNYYYKGLCFEGNEYGKFMFDNNMKIVAPLKYKDMELSKMGFKRSDVLNFTMDVFYDNTSSVNRIKEKYNNKLSLFYLEDLKDKIFVTLKSEYEKKYDWVLEDYVQPIFNIYEKHCYDDNELNVPKEFKFYDYQSNEKYTNKYIIFDNLYNKIILSRK
jgi:hypothetical protein